ncbi:MAG: hypothetical protein HN704_11065 [Bacteroidetes bacterium]|jgi:hypothetical protein|nr:hypothetical protein [Bacteroidota bacterium]MBT6687973.1 hypothetical protein [Bacteroidota bacterium]MBT7144962.1 hypothetical protein [Bacteroidota bacterium]MBT7492132.1 hypothetical protein [Bacteroidota bacterium]
MTKDADDFSIFLVYCQSSSAMNEADFLVFSLVVIIIPISFIVKSSDFSLGQRLAQ